VSFKSQIHIEDKFGDKWVVVFEKVSEMIAIHLYSSRFQRFVIGSVIIDKSTKTAKIKDFTLKKDFSAVGLGEIDFSHRGLGSKIISLLEGYLKKMGIRRIVGEISIVDKGVEKFWEKNGYRVIPHHEKNKMITHTIEKEI
jgi:GNAT superfamily N-acetyltransferase